MSKNYLILIFLATLVIGWQLLRSGYYPMHDDLQVMRLYQMQRCLKDGQIPCRWAPDMDNNYGQPMFNFYSALPYYLGGLFNLTGFTLVDTVKLLFLLSLFVSGVAVFLLTRLFLGPPAAFLAALSYMVAPYHALDIFVRGALSESWGLAFLPLVIYFCLRFLRRPGRTTGLLFSVSLAALLTTHNITTLLGLPLLFAFILVDWFLERSALKRYLAFLFYFLLGAGLAAFFFLPLLFEKGLIQIQFLTTDYFDYHAHYTTVRQLFVNLVWGYGPSKFGPDDDISFFVGVWQVAGLLLAPVSLFLFWRRRQTKPFSFLLFTWLLTWGLLLMTHNKSVWFWENLPLISIVQFPWRFLGPAALTSSLVLGFVYASFLGEKSRPWLVTLAAVFLIAVNFPYFKFEKYFYWIDDTQKLSGELYNLQVRAAMLDYLPNSVKKIPEAKAPENPRLLSGRADLNYFDKRSNYFSSEYDVAEPSVIEFPVMYFPGWTVYLDRQPVPTEFNYANDFGLITVNLPLGHHLIQAFFEDTPVRRWGNLLTFGSAIIILLLAVKRKNEN